MVERSQLAFFKPMNLKLMNSRRQFLKLPAPWLLAAGARAAIPPRPTKAIPLLLGNWADPSILKDGSDYYMTHSSFDHQPGLLVWHSKQSIFTAA